MAAASIQIIALTGHCQSKSARDLQRHSLASTYEKALPLFQQFA
jgi:hypothetical protein